MSQQPSIRRGRSADLAPLLALLEGAGLPTEDLRSNPRLDLWVLELDGRFAGVIALERYGREGLLRSLALAPEHRKRGLGALLVKRLEDDARGEGVRQLVLLTETAEAFFLGQGYEVIDRSQVSDELKGSAEFRALCPASAVCMSKVLKEP